MATPFRYLGSLPLIKHEASMKQRDALVKRISTMGITEVFAPDGASATNYILEHGAENL